MMRLIRQTQISLPANRPSGQSLSEYGLVLSLVAVVCIGGLTLFGGQVTNVLANLGASVAPHPVKAPDIEIAQVPASASPVSAVPASVAPVSSVPVTAVTRTPPPKGMDQVCFQSGSCLNVPIVPAKTSITNVSASNGIKLTGQFADTLMQIANQLAADPNADPTLRDMITKLANNGHSIADNEGSMINACPPGSECINNISAFNSAHMATYSAGNTFNSQYTAVMDYLQTNPSALPPEMQNMVTLESQQIQNIASAYIAAPTKQSSDVAGSAPSANWSVKDTQLTEQSANTICNNGGETTQCVR
jgi:Flp pilus assembly pilin Flp